VEKTCNPRSQFWVNLSHQIQLWSSHADEIILMMDTNADYADDEFSQLPESTHQLVDLHEDLHLTSPPATY
jgi:hypothetical protein